MASSLGGSGVGGGGGGGGGRQGFLLPASLEASPQRASSHAILRHAIVVQVRLDSSQLAPTLIAWVERTANRKVT